MTEKLFVQCAPMKHESINFLLCSSLPEQPLNLTAVWRWVKEARGWKLKLAGGGGLSCIIDTTFGNRHTEKQSLTLWKTRLFKWVSEWSWTNGEKWLFLIYAAKHSIDCFNLNPQNLLHDQSGSCSPDLGVPFQTRAVMYSPAPTPTLVQEYPCLQWWCKWCRCGDVTVCTWHRWCGHKGPFRALV